jgi:phosphate transport system permease protein
VAAGRRYSITRWASTGFSALALLALVAIVLVFTWQALPVWKLEGTGFVTGEKWFYRQDQYGSASMIYGTLAVALVAMILAAPIGIGSAIFCACFLPPRLRLGFKVAIELLAGVPSVVYGLLGILLLRDWVYEALERFDVLSGDSLLTAGILLAVMILPTLITLADDAVYQVPLSRRLAARGLGLTRTETILHVSLPHAWRGLLAALLLALGRACGEMIAVFLVVGRQDNQWPEKLWSPRPLIEAGQTLSTKLGSSETNIAYGHEIHWSAMVGVGLLLLFIVTTVTIIGSKIGLLGKRHET